MFLYCPGLLADLLRSVPGVEAVVAEGEALPPHDLHCPLMSLPHRLGTTLATVPARVPYVDAPAGTVERWTAAVAGTGGLTVGLYWQGNPHHVWDRHRSVRLDALEPLGRVEGLRLVSLQQGPGREQVRRAPGVADVTDLGPEFQTLTDLAGAVAAVDLVVCVDTAVAHLAGAMGRPVWVLLSAMSDWRWLADRPDTPWYPTMRLFRQCRPGDWTSVVERVATELAMGR